MPNPKESLIRRKNNFAVRKLGEESILVPTGSETAGKGGLLILNGTGRFLWELLEENYSKDDLATSLAVQFGVRVEQAKADTEVFLQELARLSLLEGG